MSGILDSGSLLFASIAAIALSSALLAGADWLPFSFYTPLLVLAVVYVPGLLLLGSLIGRIGGLGAIFQRDYSPLLTCTLMAANAVQIPLVLAAWTAPRNVFLILAGLAAGYFAWLMYFAVRTVFGIDNLVSVGIVGLSWAPLVGAVILWGPLGAGLRFLASPFFLFYLIYYLRSEFGNLGQGLRDRQNFHRMLQASTLNPHDGEAQYQLGLIYQQRHQYTEAIRRFQAAIAIDPTETDAHFQLGRIARAQNRTADALACFETVLKQNEKHASNEGHREIGAVYLTLGRVDDALRELALYTDRREYDPEGLYYYGQALERSGDSDAARDVYKRAVEAARTAPHYRRRFTAKWSRLSQRQLRKLGK